nr:hypothetical protein [Hyphomonas sp.]
AQHVRIGKQCGLTDEEIARIKKGPDAPGWSAIDTAAADPARTRAAALDRNNTPIFGPPAS